MLRQCEPLALPRGLQSWAGDPGELLIWEPTRATLRAAEQSEADLIPPSIQQDQHLRSYRAHRDNGLEMERLLVVVWDIPGRCDVELMTDVINHHLRRHDTYHSWFQFIADDQVLRSKVRDPDSIEFACKHCGVQASLGWMQQVLLTPGPLQWDCFRFGVIQRSDHFTFFAAIDHLHADAYLLPVLSEDLCRGYLCFEQVVALPSNVASYHHYCALQMSELRDLTLNDSDVQRWIQFLKDNGGHLPRYSLPLRQANEHWESHITVLELMDSELSRLFERFCRDHGVSLFTGVMACFAVNEYLITGNGVSHMITPVTTRSSRAEAYALGWFTGLVPISASIAGRSFDDILKDIHASFQRNRPLSRIPVEKLIELTQGLEGVRWPESGGCFVSFAPLRRDRLSELEKYNVRVFLNQGAARNIAIWFTNSSHGTMASISHPSNHDVAASVVLMIHGMQNVCKKVVAEGACATF